MTNGKRGEFLFDFNFCRDWEQELVNVNREKRGRPFEYPDSFMLFSLWLNCIFKIDYRTLEGIAWKLVIFIPQAVEAPDYTIFSVRLRQIAKGLEVYEQMEEQWIADDSRGLKITNCGGYRMRQYCGKRMWIIGGK